MDSEVTVLQRAEVWVSWQANACDSVFPFLLSFFFRLSFFLILSFSRFPENYVSMHVFVANVILCCEAVVIEKDHVLFKFLYRRCVCSVVPLLNPTTTFPRLSEPNHKKTLVMMESHTNLDFVLQDQIFFRKYNRGWCTFWCYQRICDFSFTLTVNIWSFWKLRSGCSYVHHSNVLVIAV